MPYRLQITHKQASDVLVELMTVINSNNPVYTAHICIKAPEKNHDVNLIEYTLTLESKTHCCMEIDKKKSNFQNEPSITQCHEYINEMALNLVQSSMDTRVLN